MAPPILKTILALAALLPFALTAPAHGRSLKIRSLDSSAQEVEGKYIVVFSEGVNSTTVASHFHTARSLTKRDGDPVQIDAEYDMNEFKGYAVTADEAAIEAIAASEEVAYVEPDQIMTTAAIVTQTNAPWGLGRISNKARGSTTYRYDDSAGVGTFIYVLDTGVFVEHSEFGGRASFGASFVPGQTRDGEGHGTHCAGTAGGSTYGIAKKASIISVKVLDDWGSGLASYSISGMQWVQNNAAANGRSAKSVMSMSLTGGASSATNSAARAVYNSGVTVVVAAGNANQDASTVSPASESTAITVASSNETDGRSFFTPPGASNYGPAVDVFAPGSNVLSAAIAGINASRITSGTSMACPLVAGLAAYLISLEGLASPLAVTNRIKQLAQNNVLTGVNGSPNVLVYNGNGA